MRFCKHQKSVAATVMPMPFDGLGFAMMAVKGMAKTMTVIHNQAGCEDGWFAVPDSVWQPSGYSLLVALGREIRGR